MTLIKQKQSSLKINRRGDHEKPRGKSFYQCAKYRCYVFTSLIPMIRIRSHNALIIRQFSF